MRSKRGLSFLLTTAMTLGMLMGVPVRGSVVEAATTTVTVGGFTLTGNNLSSDDYSYNSTTGRLDIKSNKSIKISTGGITVMNQYIYIGDSSGSDINITLEKFLLANSKGPAIEIKDNYKGDVTLTLVGNTTRKGYNVNSASNIIQGNFAPAIQKNGTNGGKLIIKGTGDLWAESYGTGVAAIGGNDTKSSSNIQINSGIVSAVTYSTGAAIGGGRGGNGSNITISGGDVYAYVTCEAKVNCTTSSHGAAIGGGGYGGDGTDITISGGTVLATATATGTHTGAGIGGGHLGIADKVSITGGTVTATGGYDSAGIGAGSEDYYLGATYIEKKNTNITISGGTVTATGGGYYGAGIGSASKDSTNRETTTTVTISGGTIKANGGQDAPGIGAAVGANSTTYISGGSILAKGGFTATSSNQYKGQDIGFGEDQMDELNVFDKILSYSSSDLAEVSVNTYTPSDSDAFDKGSIELAFKNGDGTDYSYGMKDVTSMDGKLYLYLKSGVSITENVSEKNDDNNGTGEITDEEAGGDITTDTPPTAGSDVSNDTENYIVTDTSTTGGTIEYTGPKNKNVTAVAIPATVVINGQTYQVTSIAKNAFSGCKTLKTVSIKNGITAIGANAFKGCIKLNTITIPNSVTSIGSNAFQGCKVLKTVKGCKGIKTIGKSAFSGCSKLTSIAIHNSSKLTKLGDKTFYKCTSLSKITIPKNVTTIGTQTFEGCKKLQTITIKSKKLKKVGSKAIKNIHKKAKIKCPGKTYAKKYKKLFKSKTGYKKTMKIQ